MRKRICAVNYTSEVYLSPLRFKTEFASLTSGNLVTSIQCSSLQLGLSWRLSDPPIITYNAPVYKYTSVYINGKMYTEKKIEMFVCHCNLGVETFRVWFLATIWDHKQRTNLNNVWLSGQVQSHKYQALCVCFCKRNQGSFSGECYVILLIG